MEYRVFCVEEEMSGVVNETCRPYRIPEVSHTTQLISSSTQNGNIECLILSRCVFIWMLDTNIYLDAGCSAVVNPKSQLVVWLRMLYRSTVGSSTLSSLKCQHLSFCRRMQSYLYLIFYGYCVLASGPPQATDAIPLTDSSS